MYVVLQCFTGRENQRYPTKTIKLLIEEMEEELHKTSWWRVNICLLVSYTNSFEKLWQRVAERNQDFNFKVGSLNEYLCYILENLSMWAYNHDW